MDRLRLITEALKARNNAYVPYSDYRVGAAVMNSDGTIFSGANIENASYGLTVCAERVALFNAISQGNRIIVALAVAVDTEAPASPCGACRQVISEFLASDAPIFLVNYQGQGPATSIGKLLPGAFSGESMKED